MSPEQQLERELAELRHEMRRLQDGLERNRSRPLEKRARELRESIALCERDLERLRANSTLRSFDV